MIPPDALRAAAEFLIGRLDGQWGGEVANNAAIELATLARYYPDQMVSHVEALLAALIAECQPVESSRLITDLGPDGVATNQLRALERMAARSYRSGRIHHLAEAIGLVAKRHGGKIFPAIKTLLKATSGDEAIDSTTRASLLETLAESVNSSSVAEMLPTLYTSLLSNDPVARSAAIGLWRACAKCTSALPDELTELAPRLLLDQHSIVHAEMARNITQLRLPDTSAVALMNAAFSLANYYRARDDQQTLENALKGMLWFAERTSDAKSLRIAGEFSISAFAELGNYAREKLLLDSALLWARPTAQWASAAIKVLADPSRRDRFNHRDDELLAALLEQPQGLADTPLEAFRAIATMHVPDHIGSTGEAVELLQAAGRWTDATVIATETAARIPNTTEHSTVHAAGHALAAAASAEEQAVVGDAPPGVSDWISQKPQPEFVVHAQARAIIRTALASLPVADPTSAADAISQATDWLNETTGGPPRIDPYIALARLVVHLLRYDADVQAGDAKGAATHLAATQRGASVIASTTCRHLGHDDPIKRCVMGLTTATASGVDRLLAQFASIALPLPLSDSAFRRKRRDKTVSSARTNDNERVERTTLAVCLLKLNRNPVVDVVVVRKGHAYDLTVDLLIDEWPAWADKCELQFLTTLPAEALTRPAFVFRKEDAVEDSLGLRLSQTGTLLCNVDRMHGSEPIDLRLHVRFTSQDDSNRLALIGGYQRLRFRPFDATRDALTEHGQLDQRLLELYDRLLDDETLDADDVQAFCRFFTACADAAIHIMFNPDFRAGTNVTEKQFHNAFEQRLRQDPLLEGRLTRRDPVAGGLDDLLHDDIIAELKVEKKTPRTVDDCARYIGQPTQYGVGRGSRLSVLVVLEHTKKTTPPGVLENYIGWLDPAHHNLTDRRYPSHVGIIIINTNWPVPSAWSRKRIPTHS